jgi:hypothetical protein
LRCQFCLFSQFLKFKLIYLILSFLLSRPFVLIPEEILLLLCPSIIKRPWHQIYCWPPNLFSTFLNTSLLVIIWWAHLKLINKIPLTLLQVLASVHYPIQLLVGASFNGLYSLVVRISDKGRRDTLLLKVPRNGLVDGAWGMKRVSLRDCSRCIVLRDFRYIAKLRVEGCRPPWNMLIR